MSISPLSSSLLSDLSQQHRQNPFQEIRQDFEQLSSALQSGDLSGAQSAYSSIQQLLQNYQGSSNNGAGSNGVSTIQNDFSAVGQALQSGDLTEAQSAFAQLQTDAQSVRQAKFGDTATAPQVQNQQVQNQQVQDQYVGSTSQNLSPAQQVQQEYAQLASAIQSGDLTGAQTAFAALQQTLGQQTSNTTATGATTATGSTNSDPILNDFNDLGQALQSGNLSQAQSAFAQLQSDVQNAQQNPASQAQSLAQALKTALQGHHHHHGGGHRGGGHPSTQSSNSGTSSTAATSTSTGGSLTINIYL
jgi:hypothetical protein